MTIEEKNFRYDKISELFCVQSDFFNIVISIKHHNLNIYT